MDVETIVKRRWSEQEKATLREIANSGRMYAPTAARMLLEGPNPRAALQENHDAS